jgi:protein-tyrosine phosphatase
VPVAQHRRSEESEFRLLFLCTGNVCRSAFAEVLTKHLLNERLRYEAASAFVVSSAGLHAMVGAGMHPSTREELRPWGVDTRLADRVVARQLTAIMVEQAHLVLGATLRHRAAAAQAAPVALTRTFTLREFQRLSRLVDSAELPSEPVQRAHALVLEVQRRRGLVPPVATADDEVPDPMGGPPKAHGSAAKLISDAIVTFLDALVPPPLTPQPQPGVAPETGSAS